MTVKPFLIVPCVCLYPPKLHDINIYILIIQQDVDTIEPQGKSSHLASQTVGMESAYRTPTVLCERVCVCGYTHI